MANTNFGVNHPLARKLWSEQLFREALKQTWIGRFIGTGTDSLIQLLPDTQKSAGDLVKVGLRTQLTGAGVSGDSTLEGNEEALNFYKDEVTIDQLRNAVRSQGKASEQRVPYSMREEARVALTDWYAARYDQAFFNQIAGYTGEADTRYTGMQATVAPTTAASASDATTRIICGGSQDTEASMTGMSSTAAITLRDIDRAVALAKTASPMIRPIRIKGEEYYVCFLHPFQIYQLRGQTSTAQWADIQKAALQGGQVSQNPLFTGAAGMYNNTIIHEATRLPNTTGLVTNSSYRRGVFCGAQAAIMAFGKGDGPGRFGWNEELFDYGNQLGVGAGAIWGMKKTQFNGTDFGTIVMSGYAAQP